MRFPRKRLAILILSTTVVCGAAGGAWAWYAWPERPGLSGTLRPEEDRNRRLLSLAAQEAGSIGDADARLTRQLNLADQQIRRGWGDDARATLIAAGDTLTAADAAAELNAHARLSGWVSISELSRRAGDDKAGRIACDHAVRAIKDLPDRADRCQYVMGVADELLQLQGERAATDLLTEAGAWAKDIDSEAERRRALETFASALFNLDRFDAGQAVLRNDDDAAWRSDLLMRMSIGTTAHRGDKHREGAMQREAYSEFGARNQAETADYGKPLSYEQIFRDKQKSQTQSD